MLNSLNKMIQKHSFEFVDSLLNEDVVITEKIDTYRILFERIGDELIFYTSNNKKIDLVTRTLTDIYEDALCEIPIITKDSQIPEGLTFGLYYTPVERPIRIPYTNLPKYILTDVSKRSENKILESYSYDIVKDWSAVLCMGRPPVLFEGKLNEEQKKLLISYDLKEYNGESMTFSKMIETLLGNSYSKEDIIEGVIIKSKDKLFQIISYEFDLLNEAYESQESTRDFYDIVITDINTFLETYNIPILEGESKDQHYINIINDIFNKYCESRNVIETIDPKYLMSPQFGYHGKLNHKFIINETTLSYLHHGEIYEALYKVMLSSLRKYKKPYGLLNESMVEKFNSYVFLINEYTNTNTSLDINEEYLQNDRIEELTESRSENIVIDAFKKRNPTDVDNMRVIASIQRAFEPKIRNIEKGQQQCAIYLTTFEPFTLSQMNTVKRIHDMWSCPVIICAVSNKYKIEGKDFHASDDVVKAQMLSLINENSDLIPSYVMLNSWNLTEIFEYCRPRYEPIALITDKGKKSEMTLQLFFEEEIMGGRISVDPKFNIGELENEDRLTVFRAIEDNNYVLFNELTPPCIHNLTEKLFSEYRLWSGQIIKIIND